MSAHLDPELVERGRQIIASGKHAPRGDVDRSDELHDWYGEGEPESGAELLDDIESFAARFLALPSEHHLVALSLWAVHTWAIEAFYTTPRLVLESPEWGSGKTRVLEVLEKLCYAPRLIVSTSPAALYRRIDAAGDHPPTVLQDEADAIFGRGASTQAEDLRAIYDNGYRRGAVVDRCVGDAKNMDVRDFRVFAPAALAGLEGKIPRTVTSRAIVMHMRRRLPDERLSDWRERDVEIEARPLRAGIAAWVETALDALAQARPGMPPGVRDRRAEVWEPLLSVADVAGADWPERARAACSYFESNPEDRLSLGARLLRDIQDVFGNRERMFTADILHALTSDAESEWSDLFGKPLNERRLAKELKRYGVVSETVRIGDARAKGYRVEGQTGLGQAWSRWLPDAIKRDIRDKRDIAGQRVTDRNPIRDKRDIGTDERDIRDTSVTSKTPSEQLFSENVTLVTDVTHTNGKVGDERSDDTQPPEPDTTRAGDATDRTTDDTERVQQTTERLNGTHQTADREEMTTVPTPSAAEPDGHAGKPARRLCPCGRPAPINPETGLCYWCERKAAAAEREAR
ncbi:hypothetical protein BMW24_004515 [Mycobacterium heckeshornense]|uniref:DUF3631 domain-containing protein n=1 Tax=Mycobacterium heckeshornense TaxID=110505 RepID=UPI000C17C919|nr:DUF3631 domain-containing protein [Mycobacterium heckeshornense]PIJ36961.1 hypothetical protein BMW24_004515 [Mycobacterium heckeshornense]